MLQIASRHYEVGLDPDDGGGLIWLRCGGVDVLRPAPAVRRGPLDLSCFALVPYANRIAYGRFSWRGRQVHLTPNFGDEPHALHGDGWRTAWSVAEAAADRAVLEMRHEAGEWPWPYLARLTARTEDDGVALELEVTNLGDSAMPAGLGFHPFFPDRTAARLRASLGGVWLTDPQMLPTRLAAPDHFGDWAAGAPVRSAVQIDNCHTGWTGSADILLPDRGLAVRLSAGPNLSFLQIYSPLGQDFFCVEPVSHRPDAVNAPDPQAQGVVALGPDARMTAAIRFEASLL